MNHKLDIDELEDYEKFLRWQQKQEENKKDPPIKIHEHQVIHHCKICDGVFRVKFKSGWLTAPTKVQVWGCRSCSDNLKNKDREWLIQRLLQIKEKLFVEKRDI